MPLGDVVLHGGQMYVGEVQVGVGVAADDHCFSPAAVSYTHLDVYKRQAQRYPGSSGP